MQQACMFCRQTVYLLSPTTDGCEPVTCRLLDCDTITQAKEKALDAIYRNTPFSQRPSVHDLDLGKHTIASVMIYPMLTFMNAYLDLISLHIFVILHKCIVKWST